MVVNQVGALAPVRLANLTRYTGLDITPSQNNGDLLHIRGEAGPTNQGPWTTFQEVTVYGGLTLSGNPQGIMTVTAQVPNDPNYVWARLDVIEVVGNWTLTPSIT